MRFRIAAPLAATAATLLDPLAALAGGTVTIPVPEPGTLGMLAAGIGAAVVALRLWRR
jgi:hypothetical protein